jgi:hypothetical protein
MNYKLYISHSELPPHTCTIMEAFGNADMERQLRNALDSIPSGAEGSVKVYTACGGGGSLNPIRTIKRTSDGTTTIVGWGR